MGSRVCDTCNEYCTVCERRSFAHNEIEIYGTTYNRYIQTGRWGSLKREERLCKQYRREKVEDEEHFLLRCEGWTQEREVMTECVEMQVGEFVQQLMAGRWPCT